MMVTVDTGNDFSVEAPTPSTMSTISARYPTPFTPACDGHPLAPKAGPQADGLPTDKSA
jgi:hypothetical protein